MIEQLNKKGSLLTVREDIKVLDCTIRDGGLMNGFRFEDQFVKNVYQTCLEAGVDYMEFGYKGSKKIFNEDDFGPWKFCAEKDIRRIVGENDTDLKVAVMADVGRTDFKQDVIPKSESVIDLIRVATYIHQLASALEMIADFKAKGYEVSLNLMAISHVNEKELDEALDILSKTDVDIIYVVDSFGYFYPEQIRDVARKYLEIAEKSNKKIGIHAHNNQQLAFANTIESLTLGVSYLDATIANMGRGAGNCPLELLLGFLRNPKFKIRPVLKTIESDILNLRKDGMCWGYDIPYMITGQLNLHPRSAIRVLEEDDHRYVRFYDDLLDEKY